MELRGSGTSRAPVGRRPLGAIVDGSGEVSANRIKNGGIVVSCLVFRRSPIRSPTKSRFSMTKSDPGSGSGSVRGVESSDRHQSASKEFFEGFGLSWIL